MYQTFFLLVGLIIVTSCSELNRTKDELTQNAQVYADDAFKTLEYVDHENFISELLEIIDQENIKAIVVGNPLNMDGSKGPSSQSALDKVKMIESKTNTPVALWDERLSTVGAFKISSQLDINVSKRVQKIDENAATFILQGAIEFLNN